MLLFCVMYYLTVFQCILPSPRSFVICMCPYYTSQQPIYKVYLTSVCFLTLLFILSSVVTRFTPNISLQQRRYFTLATFIFTFHPYLQYNIHLSLILKTVSLSLFVNLCLVEGKGIQRMWMNRKSHELYRHYESISDTFKKKLLQFNGNICDGE